MENFASKLEPRIHQAGDYCHVPRCWTMSIAGLFCESHLEELPEEIRTQITTTATDNETFLLAVRRKDVA